MNQHSVPVSKIESALATKTAIEAFPKVTIFTLPKPFDGGADLIQKNAIRSWQQLAPVVEVLLLGDEAGIKDTAIELGVRHESGVRQNEHGTPLINSAFEIAAASTSSPFLAYCNSDVILGDDFAKAVELIEELMDGKPFVGMGKRTDLLVEEEIDFENRADVDQLYQRCRTHGVTNSQVCKEYFLFNRGLYQNLPAFAVGRGNWDNWMIHSAKQSKVPVVEFSSVVTAIHQSHDYAHTQDGRYQCYVSGVEAQENMRLAGGRHLISGSTPTWRITSGKLKRELPLAINPAFWADVPRFARLMFSLVTG